MNNKKVVYGAFAVFLVLVALVSGVVTYLIIKEEKEDINSFDECVEAGYPIQESFPEKCSVPGGETFTNDTSESNDDSDEVENTDYYGSSTFAACEENSDCVVSGCNMEICQGKDEESLASICLAPEQDTPTEAGYDCGCVANKCQWSK